MNRKVDNKENNIDLTNLKVGMEIKSYKELCSLLGQKVGTGNQRNAQLTDWQRYFDYTRKGNKYIINDIYPTPLPKDFSKNDVYSRYIQVILTRLLKETDQTYFTTTDLLKMFGFVNGNWGNMDLLSDYCKVNNCTYKQAKYYYNQLYTHVVGYCVTAFKRCLGRLAQRKFIIWREIYRIEYYDKKLDKKVKRDATKDEEKLYLNIAYKLKEEMGISFLNIYNSKKYYQELNERLLDAGLGYMYKCFYIVYAETGIDIEIKRAEQEYNDALRNVNEHSLKQMLEYVNIDIDKDIKKLAKQIKDTYNEVGIPISDNESILFAKNKTDIENSVENKTNITNMYIDLSCIL